MNNSYEETAKSFMLWNSKIGTKGKYFYLEEIQEERVLEFYKLDFTVKLKWRVKYETSRTSSGEYTEKINYEYVEGYINQFFQYIHPVIDEEDNQYKLTLKQIKKIDFKQKPYKYKNKSLSHSKDIDFENNSSEDLLLSIKEGQSYYNDHLRFTSDVINILQSDLLQYIEEGTVSVFIDEIKEIESNILKIVEGFKVEKIFLQLEDVIKDDRNATSQIDIPFNKYDELVKDDNRFSYQGCFTLIFALFLLGGTLIGLFYMFYKFFFE